jgi:hypothetical protein
MSWLLGVVCVGGRPLLMCVRRCRGRSMRVVPTLHVGIDGGLCACEWVEGEEEEAGISNVNEWVAAVALRCVAGAAVG